jgi:hypothetical protein
VQASSGKHLEELALGSHVDGLRNQLAFAIEDEGVGNAVDMELFANLVTRVEQDREAGLLA